MTSSDAAPGQRIVRLVGVYDADGTLRGELAYWIGARLGRRHCSLCDITHSPVRRKPEWDRMVARLGRPIVLLHRNELDPALEAAVREIALPVVVAHHANGSTSVALDADDLRQLRGSVTEFEQALHGRQTSR